MKAIKRFWFPSAFSIMFGGVALFMVQAFAASHLLAPNEGLFPYALGMIFGGLLMVSGGFLYALWEEVLKMTNETGTNDRDSNPTKDKPFSGSHENGPK